MDINQRISDLFQACGFVSTCYMLTPISHCLLSCVIEGRMRNKHPNIQQLETPSERQKYLNTIEKFTEMELYPHLVEVGYIKKKNKPKTTNGSNNTKENFLNSIQKANEKLKNINQEKIPGDMYNLVVCSSVGYGVTTNIGFLNPELWKIFREKIKQHKYSPKFSKGITQNSFFKECKSIFNETEVNKIMPILCTLILPLELHELVRNYFSEDNRSQFSSSFSELIQFKKRIYEDNDIYKSLVEFIKMLIIESK